MTGLSLIDDPWIPVQRRSGRSDWIRPADLTAGDDPPVRLAAPRADFNGALAQWLIGLLQTAVPPNDSDVWADRFETPPTQAELEEAFASYAEIFQLDGDGPRFMQDLDSLDGARESGIANLLIDMPGGNTLKNNADVFTKRGGVQAMCPVCTATALFTLQINAPSGGVGHRTGLRGGGPLTTLVACDPRSELENGSGLWHDLWLNVLTPDTLRSGNPARKAPADIFPWLGDTRTSYPKTNGVDTTPDDVNPLQMYWAMPRRIRLEPPTEQSKRCGVCGRTADLVYTQYRSKNYGTNYIGAWAHPLTPHYVDKAGQALPMHPQPSGITYRHWVGLAYEDELEPGKTLRADVVRACTQQDRLTQGEQRRIRAFGYDMDNMKARCWYEAEMPLYLIPADRIDAFAGLVETFVTSAVTVASRLRGAVRDAWLPSSGEVRGDLSVVTDAFYERTEAEFYRIAQVLAQHGNSAGSVSATWRATLQKSALKIFDQYAASGDVAFADPARIARARDKLRKYLYGKKLATELGIARHGENAA